MDDKTLSDFMPKTNSEGEIVVGEFSQQSSIKLTTDEVIKKLSTIKDGRIPSTIRRRRTSGCSNAFGARKVPL